MAAVPVVGKSCKISAATKHLEAIKEIIQQLSLEIISGQMQRTRYISHVASSSSCAFMRFIASSYPRQLIVRGVYCLYQKLPSGIISSLCSFATHLLLLLHSCGFIAGCSTAVIQPKICAERGDVLGLVSLSSSNIGSFNSLTEGSGFDPRFSAKYFPGNIDLSDKSTYMTCLSTMKDLSLVHSLVIYQVGNGLILLIETS